MDLASDLTSQDGFDGFSQSDYDDVLEDSYKTKQSYNDALNGVSKLSIDKNESDKTQPTEIIEYIDNEVEDVDLLDYADGNEKEFPTYACRYCRIHAPSSVIKC